MEYILASASPRRRELLKNIIDDFLCISPDFDEKSVDEKDGRKKAIILSKAKCIQTVKSCGKKDIAVISGDTVVDFDGEIMEKPADEKQAFNMIKKLSGNTHYVHTAVTVYFKGIYYSFCDSTKVYFENIPDEDILRYVKTKEPYDKAGGYAIQGFMSAYIKKIDGNYHTVVGLPVCRLNKLLKHIKAI